MNLRNLFARGLTTLCLAELMWIASPANAASPAKAQAPMVDLRQSPTGGKSPVAVTLGLYVTNLIAINETAETFEVKGYLNARWRDPRLALPTSETPGKDQGLREFKTQDLWTPPIETANSVSHKTDAYFMEADKNGEVNYVESFTAVLSNGFDMRKFPFDSQVLQFDYQAFVSDSSAIQFAPHAAPYTGISPDQHTELAQWRVKEVRYMAEKVASIGFVPPTGEAVFQIEVQRRSGFYIWKIFLPLLLLTLIPTSVFWIDAKEIDWMLKVPMTMLLSMVAFEFTIARDLPRNGYLTFLDAVFLASFAFCFINVLELTLVYVLHRNEMRSRALALHRAGRWAYPLAYFCVVLVLAIGFLG